MAGSINIVCFRHENKHAVFLVRIDCKPAFNDILATWGHLNTLHKKADIFSPHKADEHMSKQLNIYNPEDTDLHSMHLELCFWPLGEYIYKIHSPFSCFGLLLLTAKSCITFTMLMRAV